MSSRARSSSSADRAEELGAFESAHAGDVIAGFRLVRLIGSGEAGSVYEATQLSLDRTVALRLIDPRHCAGTDARARLERELSVAASLHHAGLVPLFETGDWAGGRFVAMRLVKGESLASRLRSGGLSAARAAEILESVANGLKEAHRARLSHGAVRVENVLVDRNGTARLADLGLGRGAGADADREQLAALRRSVEGPAATRRPRMAFAIAGAAAVAVAVPVAVALLAGGGAGEGRAGEEEPAPGAPAGTVPLGSDLSPGPADPLGCGGPLGGASRCTILLSGPGGGSLEVAEPGVIRGWAVRGAAGELTLEVLRPARARAQIAGFSQPVEAPDPGPHSFSAEIGLRPGELIAVKLGPGAEVGRRGTGRGGLRWAGAGLPLPPISQATPLGGELLVRVDFEPGAKPSHPAHLVGGRARAAPDGAALAQTTVTVSARRAAHVRLVQLASEVHLDAFMGSRRTARVALAGADPEGELVLFEQSCGHPRSVCIRWRNPGAVTPLLHELRISRDGRFRVIG